MTTPQTQFQELVTPQQIEQPTQLNTMVTAVLSNMVITMSAQVHIMDHIIILMQRELEGTFVLHVDIVEALYRKQIFSVPMILRMGHVQAM